MGNFNCDNSDVVMFGYLPEFYSESEPALLFIGTNSAMLKFGEFMKGIATGKLEALICLNEVDCFCAMNDTHTFLSMRNANCGAKRISADGNKIQWTISPSQAISFSEAIMELSKSSGPAHQYLDCDDLDELNVIVSVGEYTKNIFEPGRAE